MSTILCSWGSHIPQEWNLEQHCCENQHGDLLQDLGNISPVEWKTIIKKKKHAWTKIKPKTSLVDCQDASL
jgi:hypothetical protein